MLQKKLKKKLRIKESWINEIKTAELRNNKELKYFDSLLILYLYFEVNNLNTLLFKIV